MAKQTIRDIARQAGVSASTVSFVINNRPGVCDETRRKVQKILDETNFTPNLSSRRLVFKRSYNICLLFDSAFSPFRDMFFWMLSRCMLEGFRKYGYNLVMNETMSGDEIPDCVLRQDVDGVICFLEIAPVLRAALNERGIPYVVVDALCPDENDPYVKCDYEQSAYVIMDYLRERGMRDIGLIGSRISPTYFKTFFSGCERAALELGMTIRPEAVRSCDGDTDTARVSTLEMLNNCAHPEAIVSNDDIFAVGALKACREYGLRIPDDISIIGVNDLPIAYCTDPGLTTLRIDPAQMAEAAVSLIMALINGAPGKSAVIHSTQIIARGSVRQ